MFIRNATESDTTALKRLLDQLGYSRTDEEILEEISLHTREGYSLMVAEKENEVVGFISLHWFDLFHRHEKLGRISAFCVDEKSRDKGIGIKLLEASENLLKSKGCARIEVTSNNRRKETHQFYLNRGFKNESRRFSKNIGQVN